MGIKETRKGLRALFPGLMLCLSLALVASWLATFLPVVGAPVLGMLLGMLLSPWVQKRALFTPGLRFSSKKLLQLAVILLGFSLNLGQVFTVGLQSLPVILASVGTALLIAFLGQRVFKMNRRLATLVGVGSSICGGSAIAATAPLIQADEEEVAQSMSVIFLFNLLAALIFPNLGQVLNLSDQGFALFAGTAVNDTSSVTATASIWDSLHGTQILAQATLVKLTRTLAIIPITLGLALWEARDQKNKENQFSWWQALPNFIVYFLLASFFVTLLGWWQLPLGWTGLLKTLSHFFIVLAMTAIGLSLALENLLRSGKIAFLMGGLCWLAISLVSLGMQKILGLW